MNLLFRNVGLLVLLATLMLAGCATRTGNQSPAPASIPAKSTPEPVSAPVIVPDEPQIAAYIPPKPPEFHAKPKPARAVQVLMARADEQRSAGNLVAAVGNLERALRIEPRNPALWNQLAHVRMDQQQYSLARELASKSIATASGLDNDLKADSWTLIAESRRATGDIAGARTAERKATALR